MEPQLPDPQIPPLDIEMFGIIKDKKTGEMRPVLQRQAKGRRACKKCRGFGTYGNPLCGAVYTCKVCDGTGKRPPSWWRKLLRIA